MISSTFHAIIFISNQSFRANVSCSIRDGAHRLSLKHAANERDGAGRVGMYRFGRFVRKSLVW